ncbi:DEDD exonuclease domain-containing protein [soil metagenome]
MTTTAAATSRWEVQRSFDELGRPLRDVTFCVFDLETTGGSAQGGSMITEIGAVKVRGGEVLGEFQTLVNPRTEIPAFIAVLTGISNSMVADSPPIESVLPAFLEFAAGTVLVAHNAPFDVGFLRYFAEQQDREWPAFEVVDTAVLARRVITRDDAPNCKLSSLAKAFGSTTTPNHRALSDARATVDVLHALMERIGGLGVHTLEELQTFSSRVSAAQRRKRHLADGLPHSPGVYLFTDDHDRVLYIGTSKDLRTRVRSYFTASETRSRMGEVVRIAAKVTGIECATPLEAEVRELRLIAQHKPSYNRRSRFPEKVTFVKLTREPWPRLSLVKKVLDDEADYLGPFASRSLAEKCLAALHETFPVRQCTDKLARSPRRTACVLAEMGRCLSPCDGSVDEHTYAAVVRQLRETLLQRPDDVVDLVNAKMAALAADERFEEAGVHRDRLAAFVRAAARTQRLSSLTHCAEVFAARR